MNNNNKGKTFIKHLEQEIDCISELNRLLSEEKIVLATRQFDKLEDLAEKKQKLSTQLEESAAQRMHLLDQANTKGAEIKSALSTFLQQCTAEDSIVINKLNSQLADGLNRCKELNTVNGQVIANNMHTRQQIINALSGNKADAVSVYNSNGNIETPTEGNHHQEA